MRFIDFFAGIGGFRMGLELAGHKCVGYCEIDKHARRSYEAILRGGSRREIFPIRGKSTGFIKRVQSDISGKGYRSQQDRVYMTDGIMGCIPSSRTENKVKIVLPVLTPNRLKKRQNGRRIKKPNEPMFTLTGQDIHGVAIAEATKKGYDIAYPGDSINLAMPNSKTRRGRVGKGIANTLDTSCNQGVVINHGKASFRDYSTCIGANYYKGLDNHQSRTGVSDGIRIRRLTPLECWRLQGFPDWSHYKAKDAGVSETQLYKQAGNGVSVPVVKVIGEKIIPQINNFI